MSTNKVDFIRGEVTRNQPDWNKVDDVVAGERRIESKGAVYLPKPNAADTSAENVIRYKAYLERAVFFNATGRTLEGLIGIAYGRDPEIVLPVALEFLLENADGAGVGLVNQSHRTLESVMKNGRAGLLVDFPAVNETVSKAQQTEQNIRAKIVQIAAGNIINWRLNSRLELSLVVIAETVEVPAGFGTDTVEQWRELALGFRMIMPEGEIDNQLKYVVRIWRKDQDKKLFIFSEIVPKDSAGQVMNLIPFTFAGAIDNNCTVDKSPILDLTCLNIGHYRNSADYEESVFFVGQPTHVFSGLTQQWVEDVWKDAVYVGSRAAVPLPVGGSASMLQAAPNTLARDAMTSKEGQMVALGARLLTHGEAIKTAEQSRSETAASHSVLSLASDNVSAAYTKALSWAAQFTRKADGDVSFLINTDFIGLMADSNLVTAIVGSWQSGAIPTSDKNAALRLIGLIKRDKTDEAIAEELDTEGAGLGLDE